MDKRIAKKKVMELIEKFQSLQSEFQELQEELNSAADEIEPYEGREELTQAQEDRIEWLNGLADSLSEIADLDIEYSVSDYIED